MSNGLWRPNAVLWVLLSAFLLVMASLVVGALRRTEQPELPITPPNPVPVGDSMVGPVQYTLDATDGDRWRFFDFSRNSVVENPGPLDWDLAARRWHVIANGGPGFAGRGGIVDLGPVPFDSVRLLPDSGYRVTTPDSANPGIGKWYRYSWTTHLLTPKLHVYGLRTADGRYVKFQIVSYYCGEARAGCLTIRYVYQGDGSRRTARVADAGPARRSRATSQSP